MTERSELASGDVDEAIRREAMLWLDARGGEESVVTLAELRTFEFREQRIPLINPPQGIRKPNMLETALSIMTTYTPPGKRPPYEDQPGPDGRIRYKYQRDNPQRYVNVGLRRAFERGLPLIWFIGVAPGLYLPRYPVWIDEDHPEAEEIVLAMNQSQRGLSTTLLLSEAQRSYMEHVTRKRVHQPVFRRRVMTAYQSTCAMCRLRHEVLLDAAHILRDRHPRGIPAVSNGIALCKIHHTAYDQDLIGIRPDRVVEVRRDILDEADGPMLEHGLKEMQNVSLAVPRSRQNWPDPVALEERYEEFKSK